MEHTRTRICICYLITTFLISAFIYTLLSSNLQIARKLGRLQEEVDEISHSILHGTAKGESKQLTEVVDAILKKRLAGIWDDLYTVKKQMKNAECSVGGAKRKDAVGEKVTEDRVNYASEHLGAKIQTVIADPPRGTNMVKSLLRLDFSANPPINLLHASMSPGDCFAFRKPKAEVVIRLAKEIFIETIEMEHITENLSPTGETTSAPKCFSVYGIRSSYADMELGSFQYDNSPTNRIQSYPVKAANKFNIVRFKFESNHGHPNYTCVYRVAVYGRMQ